MSDPPVFDALYACVEYNEWRGAALKKFKFQREMIYGECWAYVLDQHLSRLDPSWLKVPWITVPIHWKRYWIRGFNQTDWLLRRIKSLHVMYALQKIKNTRRQSLGHSRERMRRQTGSFRWREGVPIMPHVVLFEDVVTTMSTISEVARVCKSMGVQRVDVVTLMRTLPS
jgi:ComF family protein